MAGKDISVKKHVVRLSTGERKHLQAVIRKGKEPGEAAVKGQCLDRRIPDKQTLIEEIAAWEHDRNANHTKADWQFTTQSARVKLKYLYPSI